MTTINELLINSRAYTVKQQLEMELQLDSTKNYLFDLSYLAALDIEGEKAAAFLQGQVTCDINTVSDIQMAQGALCNLKGRILALFDVVKWQGYKLIMPADLIDSTQNSLAKSAMLSRVVLKLNKKLHAFGFYFNNDKDLLPDFSFFSSVLYAQSITETYCYYHLGQGFYIILVPNEQIDALCEPFISRQQLLGSLSWHGLRLIQHEMSIYPESKGLFLPHRLDLHKTKQLSFDKGCYKGQEIIARTQYRATIKHELKVFTVDGDFQPFSGQKLLDPKDNREIGELVDYSQIGPHLHLVAVSVLKEAGQEVRFENSEQPYRLTPVKPFT